ncbi:AI-2E family transporter [Deltaproteobacteria bacterium PRO3]|nr:AI-2E family transporter [Deltaproteobacteria bacterium PRO3]
MANSVKTEQRAFILLLLVLIAVGVYLIHPFLQTLILSGVFTVLFYPIHQKFLNWTKQRANVAATLSVTTVILFIFLPIAILLTLVTTQLASLVTASNFSITQSSVAGLLTAIQQKITFFAAKFEYLSGFNFDLVPLIQQAMSRLAQILAKYSPSVLAGTANFILHFFIMIIVLFYLFRDGREFLGTLIRLSPVKDQYEQRLAGEIRDTIYGVFYGNFLTGLAQAALATAGYYLAGIEAYLVWGAVTFFMSFLPMLGTGAVIAPLVLVLFIQGHSKQAVFLAVYGAVVISSVDNLLRPVLIRSNMHQLVLFLSIFGGLAVFGPIGILLGPMLLAMLTATIRIYAKDFASVNLPEKKPS